MEFGSTENLTPGAQSPTFPRFSSLRRDGRVDDRGGLENH